MTMTANILEEQRYAMPAIVSELFRRHALFAGSALCFLILMAPTLFAMAADDRTFLDINVWVKPLKFEIALAIYLATLAWFAGWLPESVVRSRWHRVYSVLVVLCIAAEMIWIGGAAAFGVASHFNSSSASMITLYAIMGVLAVLLTSMSLTYGIIFLRDRASRLDPAFRLSVGIGLIATFVLTVMVAGYMSSNGSHFIGGNQSDAEGFPLMGWARDGGDLRVAHFFATHAMHFIPAVGFIASTLLAAPAARLAVLGITAGYVGLVGYAFIEGLLGGPFLSTL
jgi:hypothetical protein